MDLPSSVEPAGILLFKSFSYLASFPKCEEAGPIPLTLEGFVTAFAIITGKLEKDTTFAANFEDLFLESIAVLPAPTRDTDSATSPKYPPLTELPDASKDGDPKPASRGLSLADLGVNFDDDDQIKRLDVSSADQDISKDFQILCRDISTILVFLLWIVRMEWADTQHPFPNNDSCHEEIDMANIIVNSITTFTYNEDASELPYTSRSKFYQWRTHAAPNLFKGLQSFVYNKFAMYDQSTIHSTTSIRSEVVLSADTIPKPDKTELLTSIHAAMLSWNLPAPALSQKQWNLLYNADSDGYAMNNFISHVFKYPGKLNR